jgi:hypothetical protein
MSARTATTRRPLMLTASVVVTVLTCVAVAGAARSTSPKPPATKHAVVRGSVGRDVTYVGDLKRTGATRWCGTLEVSVDRPNSGSPPIEDIYGSGRECGTILQQSVVMVALACPRAIGVGAVLRGRPRLRVRLAGGRTRSVPVRRLRDRHNGTFYSLALTGAQLPAKIQIVGGATVADVPRLGDVC